MSNRLLRSNPKLFVSMVLGCVLLLACTMFWYWLTQQNNYAFGCVTETIQATSSYEIALLHNPVTTETTPLAIEADEMLYIEVGDWLLTKSSSTVTSGELFVVEEIISNGLITKLTALNPQQWLDQLGSNSYLAIIVAGLLVIFAVRSLQAVYSLILSGFLMFTLWHAGHVAQTMSLMHMDGNELYLLMAIAVLYGVWSSYVYDKYQISSRIVASLATYLFGVQVLNWFGINSSAAIYILFAAGIISPVLISSVFAGYLLSSGLQASLITSYITLFVVMLMSYGMHARNSCSTYGQFVNSMFKRTGHRLKNLMPSQSKLDVRGKVTLAELLAKRSKRNG